MKQHQYIHYGSSHFERARFIAPRNCWWQPKPENGTGLWASRENDPLGWKCWCERNDFALASLDKSFRFTMADGANLITLQSAGQLSQLPRLSLEEILQRGNSEDEMSSLAAAISVVPQNWCMLDYEKMARDGVDAIEIVNWPEFRDSLPTWDCNCIYIMNPDVIHEITEDSDYPDTASPRDVEIWIRRNKGESLSSIARDYGITRQRVFSICKDLDDKLGFGRASTDDRKEDTELYRFLVENSQIAQTSGRRHVIGLQAYNRILKIWHMSNAEEYPTIPFFQNLKETDLLSVRGVGEDMLRYIREKQEQLSD